MSKEFIPYEEALALKELGFDEECLKSYHIVEIRGQEYIELKEVIYDNIIELCHAPLYQQAFRWFREKYELVPEIQAPDGKEGVWNPTIHKVYGFGNYYDNNGFKTYEEAEIACLRKLIEIVKFHPLFVQM